MARVRGLEAQVRDLRGKRAAMGNRPAAPGRGDCCDIGQLWRCAEAERRAERDEKLLVEEMKRWPPEVRKAFEQNLQLHGGEKP